MSKNYGHRWISAYGVCDDGTWQTAICKLTLAQIEKGILISIEKDPSWPPTKGEFINYCKLSNEDLNIPNFEKVFSSVLNHKWIHPIVNEIYQEVGHWDLTHNSEKDLRRQMKNIYDELLIKISEGNFEYRVPVEKKFRIEKNQERERKFSESTKNTELSKMRESLKSTINNQNMGVN